MAVDVKTPMPAAKRKGDHGPRPVVSVKIDADVYRLVRTVAAWKGVAVSDYLSGIVGPLARKDFARMQKEMSDQGEGK
jgi:hypothetical protein